MSNHYTIKVTVIGHDNPAEAVLDAAAELGSALAADGAIADLLVSDTFGEHILDARYGD